MLPILLALVIIAILFFVMLVGRPDDFKVTRSTVIAVTPDKVFPHVNDFHKWDDWSPWAKLDPACKNTFSGAAAGKDAGFAWDGNKKVGAGRMTITESRPNNLIVIDLHFLRPFEASSITEFAFQPEGNGTKISWSMMTRNNLMSKVFGIFADCDNMVGKDFEKGLASLKSILEAGK